LAVKSLLADSLDDAESLIGINDFIANFEGIHSSHYTSIRGVESTYIIPGRNGLDRPGGFG